MSPTATMEAELFGSPAETLGTKAVDLLDKGLRPAGSTGSKTAAKLLGTSCYSAFAEVYRAAVVGPRSLDAAGCGFVGPVLPDKSKCEAFEVETLGFGAVFGKLMYQIDGFPLFKSRVSVRPHAARSHGPTLAEMYPDLDLPAIEVRAEEVRRFATDSEALSRVLDHPVQAVHQAE